MGGVTGAATSHDRSTILIATVRKTVSVFAGPQPPVSSSSNPAVLVAITRCTQMHNTLNVVLVLPISTRLGPALIADEQAYPWGS